jgi:hypothetical protein
MLTVMDRDRRLTGYLRGQIDQPTAPAGFEVSNGWRVSHTSFSKRRSADEAPLGREACHVNYIQIHPETDDSTLCAEPFFLVTIETTKKHLQRCPPQYLYGVACRYRGRCSGISLTTDLRVCVFASHLVTSSATERRG